MLNASCESSKLWSLEHNNTKHNKTMRKIYRTYFMSQQKLGSPIQWQAHAQTNPGFVTGSFRNKHQWT